MTLIPKVDVGAVFFGRYNDNYLSYKRDIYFFKNGKGALVTLAHNPVDGNKILLVHELVGTIDDYRELNDNPKRARNDDELRELLERIRDED